MASLPLTNLHGAFEHSITTQTASPPTQPVIMKIFNAINIQNLKTLGRFLFLIIIFFLILRFLYETSFAQSSTQPAANPSLSNLAANVQLLNLIRDARIIPFQASNKTLLNKIEQEPWGTTSNSTPPSPPPPPPPSPMRILITTV